MEIMQANDAASAKQAMLDFDATLCYVPISYIANYYAYDSDLDMGPYAGSYSVRKMKWK